MNDCTLVRLCSGKLRRWKRKERLDEKEKVTGCQFYAGSDAWSCWLWKIGKGCGLADDGRIVFHRDGRISAIQ